jgi:hypothetical protein
MADSTAKVLKKLMTVAKTGAATNIEKENVSLLAPVAVMALRDSEEIKIARLKTRGPSSIKKALQSCLNHYDAYAYAFVKEGVGTEFPEALLAAEGNFRLLPPDDKYEVVTLKTGIDGMPPVFISRARITHTPGGRRLAEWTDVRLEEDSVLYTTDWEANESGI